MALLTPVSDSLPSMIPPVDFPVEGRMYDTESVRVVHRRGSANALVTIEAEELRVLTDLLAAFSRYITDRHNPDASFDTLQAYRAAMRFYGDA